MGRINIHEMEVGEIVRDGELLFEKLSKKGDLAVYEILPVSFPQAEGEWLVVKGDLGTLSVVNFSSTFVCIDWRRSE